MDNLLVTACTNRKRMTPLPSLTAAKLPHASCERVLADWIVRLSKVEARVPAKDLYCGRSFVEACQASRLTQGPLFIISAGLGMVSADQPIPSYSLTVSSQSNQSVLRHFSDKASKAEWWEVLSRRSPFSHSIVEVIEAFADGLVLLALPWSYLLMIQGDLRRLGQSEIDRLRIFVLGKNDELDPLLRSAVMPYDARLDGSDSNIRGTRGDFPQRALRHFVEHILPESQMFSAIGHQTLIRSILGSWRQPGIPKRPRRTDQQIKALIASHWDNASGQSSRMLRHLRDHVQVACEQGRFQRLFREVRREIEGGSRA